jgi:hypothetical protein
MVLERKKRRLDQLHALKSMVRVSFLASTTIGHVETLRRSQTRARKSELELNLEATRGLLFIFFKFFLYPTCVKRTPNFSLISC